MILRRSAIRTIAGASALALAALASLWGSVLVASATELPHSKATRIVAVGGAVTEIVYALGLEKRLVGIDTTSLYPPEALKQKPNVGYMRQLSAEGVLGLNPDLIIAAEGAGPKETLAVLNEAKVPIVTVPETFTEDGILERIRIVARELGAEKHGQCLIESVTNDLAKLRKLRENIAGKRRVMFVMSMVGGRAMVAGRKTAADAIISLAGAVNAVEGYDGYKSLNEEAIVTARPDAILVMERGRDSISSDAIFSNAAFAMTPAAESKTFVAMDGLYLLGFGPRTASAARDLARALYPRLPEAEEPAAPAANCRQ